MRTRLPGWIAAGLVTSALASGVGLGQAPTAGPGDPLATGAAGRPGGEVSTNSLGMRFVRVPAGEFVMGNREWPEVLARSYPAYEPRRFEEIRDDPAHRVRITRPFDLGAHEVTVGQFRRFVEDAGYLTEPERDGTGGWGYDPRAMDIVGRDPRYSWKDPGFPQGDDHPVVNITWNDAVAFCRWLGRTEGRTYRLPTEAEWEYACRAGTSTRYSFGDDPEGLAAHANVFDATARPLYHEALWGRYALSGRDGFAYTAPVGSFRPNRWGLYDMHGNVWEWCSDWYDETYYPHSPADDPAGPATGHRHARRGGAWHSFALYARSNFRNLNTPESRYPNLGLRVVREVGPQAAGGPVP